MKKAVIVLAAGLAALSVSGCNPEEQGRPLSFAGSYTGFQKPTLSPETLRHLTARTEYQRGLPPQIQQPVMRAVSGASPWRGGASVRSREGS